MRKGTVGLSDAIVTGNRLTNGLDYQMDSGGVEALTIMTL